jgi:hypothetical protein
MPVEEVEAALLVGHVARERRHAAGGVAFGALDLDHIGAKIGQHLGAVGTLLVNEIKDTVATECPFLLLSHDKPSFF